MAQNAVATKTLLFQALTFCCVALHRASIFAINSGNKISILRSKSLLVNGDYSDNEFR